MPSINHSGLLQTRGPLATHLPRSLITEPCEYRATLLACLEPEAHSCVPGGGRPPTPELGGGGGGGGGGVSGGGRGGGGLGGRGGGGGLGHFGAAPVRPAAATSRHAVNFAPEQRQRLQVFWQYP